MCCPSRFCAPPALCVRCLPCALDPCGGLAADSNERRGRRRKGGKLGGGLASISSIGFLHLAHILFPDTSCVLGPPPLGPFSSRLFCFSLFDCSSCFLASRVAFRFLLHPLGSFYTHYLTAYVTHSETLFPMIFLLSLILVFAQLYVSYCSSSSPSLREVPARTPSPSPQALHTNQATTSGCPPLPPPSPPSSSGPSFLIHHVSKH